MGSVMHYLFYKQITGFSGFFINVKVKIQKNS